MPMTRRWKADAERRESIVATPVSNSKSSQELRDATRHDAGKSTPSTTTSVVAMKTTDSIFSVHETGKPRDTKLANRRQASTQTSRRLKIQEYRKHEHREVTT